MMKPWETHFEERDLKEISFCRNYAKKYRHGTDGHIKFMIIAKMADLLDSGVVPFISNIPKNFDATTPIIPKKPPSTA
jgi:hypothetical protein